MAYDLHGVWDRPKVVGHNSPLYAYRGDPTPELTVVCIN